MKKKTRSEKWNWKREEEQEKMLPCGRRKRVSVSKIERAMTLTLCCKVKQKFVQEVICSI